MKFEFLGNVYIGGKFGGFTSMKVEAANIKEATKKMAEKFKNKEKISFKGVFIKK